MQHVRTKLEMVEFPDVKIDHSKQFRFSTNMGKRVTVAIVLKKKRAENGRFLLQFVLKITIEIKCKPADCRKSRDPAGHSKNG